MAHIIKSIAIMLICIPIILIKVIGIAIVLTLAALFVLFDEYIAKAFANHCKR